MMILPEGGRLRPSLCIDEHGFRPEARSSHLCALFNLRSDLVAMAGLPCCCCQRTGLFVRRAAAFPDLDINSRPYQRWGVLRWLWWPYQRLIRHRSVLSHSPFLGTAIRISYLTCLVISISWLGSPWGTPTPERWLFWLQQGWNAWSNLVSIGLIGIEASTWLHLIQDGDPMPRLSFKPWLRR